MDRNSALFEKDKDLLESLWDNAFSVFDWQHILLDIILVILLTCCCFTLWLLFRHYVLKHRKSRSLRNSLFYSLVFSCLTGGILVYFIGYDYAGTSKNFLTLTLRSILSSFEMFLSKSNLIGIAENCQKDPLYMTVFSIVHTMAVVLSTYFAVACFGKRIKYWYKAARWGWFGRNKCTYVFWGLNERSYMMANDLYEKSTGRERIVFIDFPGDKEEENKSQSFSSLIGLLSFKLRIVRQVEGIDYLLFRSLGRVSELSDKDEDFFDSLGLVKLRRILERSESSYHFLLTDNESSNLKAAVNMLERPEFLNGTKIYCSARKTQLTRLIEEQYAGSLVIIDDSLMAVNSLKLGEAPHSYPIDYVKVNTQNATVDSRFTALIIGFGTTGQDAMRFLYEFSAFPNAYGGKSQVKIHAVDQNMDRIRGSLMQEIPALEYLEGWEIELHHMDIASKAYYDLLKSIIKDLNYVVIATGDDERNIEQASSLLEMVNRHRDGLHPDFRVFVRLYREENRIKYLSAINVYGSLAMSLSYFGSTKSLYTKSHIINNRIQLEAEEFQKSYCTTNRNEYIPYEQRLKQVRETPKAELAYAYRNFQRKESQNKANRAHIYTKIKLMGLTDVPEKVILPAWTETHTPSQWKTEKAWTTRLINASICEHLRWNASHLMMGYIPMTEEVKEHATGTCDIRKKQHSCIVDWKELDKQAYDYYVVRTSIYLYLKETGKSAALTLE